MTATSSGKASWEIKEVEGEDDTFEASYSLTMILASGEFEDGDEETVWICMPLLDKNYCQFYRYEARAATETIVSGTSWLSFEVPQLTSCSSNISNPTGVLYDTVDTLVGRQGTFDMVSRTYVENVLSQMGKQPRVELLLDPQVRRGVIERFEQAEGREYIRYILWGKLNNATTKTGRDEKEKKYVLGLEMVDVKTGLQLKEQVSARKEYEE